jgi:Fe-S-cluster containining protein
MEGLPRMPVPLSRPYPSRYGPPIIDRFDPRIFSLTFFAKCMACTNCHDACCQYGVDIELPRVDAIDRHRRELELYLNVPRSQWFRDDPDDFGIVLEPEYPGGAYTRTAVVPLPAGRSGHSNEACVFLDPVDRGCRIHRFALERDLDPHEIKPMVCFMFPVLHAEGVLIPAVEFEEGLMVCEGPGETLYRAARSDLEYYFGADLIGELDTYEAMQPFQSPQTDSGRIPLPVGS